MLIIKKWILKKKVSIVKWDAWNCHTFLFVGSIIINTDESIYQWQASIEFCDFNIGGFEYLRFMISPKNLYV